MKITGTTMTKTATAATKIADITIVGIASQLYQTPGSVIYGTDPGGVSPLFDAQRCLSQFPPFG
jgi:hypothetical protein